MRGSYLFFITALFAISALVYLVARPQELAPGTERLIREVVREAVAENHRSAPLADSEAVRQAVQRAVAQEMQRQAATAAQLQQHLKAQQRQLDALHTEVTTDARLQNRLQRDAGAREIAMKHANRDALVMDALRITSDLQAWKLKPPAFGGGRDHDGFEGVTFEDLGRQVEDGRYATRNGVFQIDPEKEQVRLTGTNELYNNQIVVTITGTTSKHVSTQVGNVK